MFLVDSSASVGADNFYNEIKFIRKLLADVTVSYNTTRVVVITSSAVDQVNSAWSPFFSFGSQLLLLFARRLLLQEGLLDFNLFFIESLGITHKMW